MKSAGFELSVTDPLGDLDRASIECLSFIKLAQMKTRNAAVDVRVPFVRWQLSTLRYAFELLEDL
jgi:hypothetical protein